LLDQVAFRLSKASSALWHETHVQLRVEEKSVIVRQDFEFVATGMAVRPLRLAVPPSLRGKIRIDSTAARLVSDPQSDELVCRLASDSTDSAHVKLSYRVEPVSDGETGDASRIVVPLVSVANGLCETTEAVVTGSRNDYLRVAGSDWQAVSVFGAPQIAK